MRRPERSEEGRCPERSEGCLAMLGRTRGVDKSIKLIKVSTHLLKIKRFFYLPDDKAKS